MAEELCLCEYHRASNKVQLVRMSSFIDNESQPTVFPTPKRVEEADSAPRNHSRPIKRSSTIYMKGCKKSSCLVTEKVELAGQCISAVSTASSIREEAAEQSPKGSGSVVVVAKEPFAVTSPSPEKDSLRPVEQHCRDVRRPSLRDQLAASLSPSPFREVNQKTQEDGIKQLVASSETKHLLLSSFYCPEAGAENSATWKKALKDYIFHTLQSICIIKKLKEVPATLLARKAIKLDPISANSIIVAVITPPP